MILNFHVTVFVPTSINNSMSYRMCISQLTFIEKYRQPTNQNQIMKFIIAVLALLAVTTYVAALPMPSEIADHEAPTRLEDVDTDGGLGADPSMPIVRERRLTCDFFSFSSSAVTPNHAACAAKCIGKGRKGGSCQGTNCVCRGDKWVG